MPASSTSALNAWGVYLVASVALVGLLAPALTGLAADSREASDLRVADGIRSVINSLQPGTSIELSYGTWSTSDHFQLDGKQISVGYGRGTIILPVKWGLPNVTLVPDVLYHAWLVGNEVEVAAVG